MMGWWGVHLFLLVALVQVFGIESTTNTDDFVALKSVKYQWDNQPPTWRGDDPCGGWIGINCNNDRIDSITLASMNLRGGLSSDITGLTELEYLDLSNNKDLTGPLPSSIGSLKNLKNLYLIGCGFNGQIPSSLGSLSHLSTLSLNVNNFIGEIPPELGNLSNLTWLDLADNQLTGTIPVSPGLDMLIHTKHFHLGKNRLSGAVPPQLFSSDMSLIHLLLDNNQLTGTIPSTLGLVQSLEVVRLDRNSLKGHVPENFNNLTAVQALHLSNNQLTGPLPNLTGMDALNYVDMSNNSFNPSDIPPWFSKILSLTSLILENTNIQGPLPPSLFSLPQLQTVNLKRNQINGTLDIGTSYSNQLRLIDLQSNSIDGFTERAGYKIQTILVDNPACSVPGEDKTYCTIHQHPDSLYSTAAQFCEPPSCRSNKVSSPTCKCGYPYSGNLFFRAPSFSNYGNKTLFESLEKQLMNTFISNGQPVDSVSLSNPARNSDGNLEMNLEVFPAGQDYFNRTGITRIGFILSNQTFKPPHGFGPFFFRANIYPYFEDSKKSPNTGLIIGAAVGGCVLLLLLILAGFYGFRQQRRAETATKKNNPFAKWDSNSNSGGVPQLKGARSFSFQELKKSTNNFSEDNAIGTGGYGKVYRGILSNGQVVAIKRAQQGSMQGGLEFKTEIELLSRVHHRNVVSLVGFCFDEGEQMLIYEYIPNGTLKDSFTGKSGIRLDWLRRLRIALGAARGLQYLHDLATPAIIHRDIKSNNILLDERLNAKVADFGLSKPLTDSEKGHVTTQVKGTMGYMDPEYYMTQQLNEKSDVYSFGVLLLEILTARSPIEKGKYIVREVKDTMDPSKVLYNLQRLLDPMVANNTAPGTVERFVDLALKCVEESGINRPCMSDVAKEIESIMELAGLNPNAESTSTSNSYEGEGKGTKHPYTNESLFSHSGSYPSSTVEPK